LVSLEKDNMKQCWAGGLFVLALLALPGTTATAQGKQSSRDNRTGSELKQNYPNPFTSDTRIAFSVGGYPNCTDPSRQYRVSLKIFNLLTQQVAVPVLEGGVAAGRLLENVFLTCGEYTAYWEGRVSGSGREAASGIYVYKLEVNGSPLTRKMTIRKQE
jgi:hypothetical protein